VSEADLALLARVAVGFALAFIFGAERELRGAPAGDRAFALIGASAAAITAVAAPRSPQTIAGVVTGIGFIGGGVIFRGEGGLIKGITTAASVFATAAIGVVVGFGHLLLGFVVAAGVLLTLELPYLPFLSRLDARRYADRFQNDRALEEKTGPPESRA
jgi:putative Mg2+ transporter-C (MgtC) family protein